MSLKMLHLNWLYETGRRLTTVDGTQVEVLEFRFVHDDDVLSEWAKHFRNHYCLDEDIDSLRSGIGCSRADYLRNIKFPDKTHAPGPSIRAGDFSEILIADYVEYGLEYWVPRTHYSDKTIRNESTKGCDIVGFKFADPSKFTPNDTLIIFEAKAGFSRSSGSARLLDAITDSGKDITRKAESLNAIKQRLLRQREHNQAATISRFQNHEDNPYKEVYGAAAVYSTEYFDPTIATAFDAKNHPAYKNLFLLVIHGTNMMTLVHDLYRRAADEA